MAAYSSNGEIAQFQEAAENVLKMLAPPSPENTVLETLNPEGLLKKINEASKGFQTQLDGLKDRTDLLAVAQDFVFFLNKVIGYYHSCDERIQNETASQYYEAIRAMTNTYYDFMYKHYKLIERDSLENRHFIENIIPLVMAINEKEPSIFEHTVSAILITDIKNSVEGVLRKNTLAKKLLQALLPEGSTLNKEQKGFAFKSISSIMKIAFKSEEATQKYKVQLLSGFTAKGEVLTPERERQEFEKGRNENVVVVLFPDRLYSPNPLSEEDYTVLKTTLFSDDLTQKNTSNGVDRTPQHRDPAKKRAKDMEASGSCAIPGNTSPKKNEDSSRSDYIAKKEALKNEVQKQIAALKNPQKGKLSNEEKAHLDALKVYRDDLDSQIERVQKSSLTDFFSGELKGARSKPDETGVQFTLSS